MPLAVQIWLEKTKHAALNHALRAFAPGHVLFSLPVFPVGSIIQEEICACKCVDMCSAEVGVGGSQGRCKHPGQIVIDVGLTPVFASRLWLCVCVCACVMQVCSVADKHHHVEWCASWMLVVWRQQHIIISLEARTEWSLQPPPQPTAVCSVLIYMLKLSFMWSVCKGD